MKTAKTEMNQIEQLASRYAEANVNAFTELHNMAGTSKETLMRIGLPNRKHEDYKYFDVHRKLNRDYSFVLPEHDKELGSWVKNRLINDDKGIHIVFINGRWSPDYSSINPDFQGMKFSDMSEVTDPQPDTVQYFEKNRQNVNKDPYLDLNNSFPNTGYILTIDKSFSNQPIYLYHLTTDKLKDKLMNLKGIILVEENANAKIVEIFNSGTENHYFHNHNTEIFTRSGANLDYYLIEETGNDAVCVNNTNIYQYRDSLVNAHTFSLHGKYLRNNLNMLLNEEHCESHLFGLYFISGSDLIDNHTTVDHKKPHCFSNEYYKGIINENGTGVFNGKIYVRPNAQKTNAFQSNKNLVLTDTATINTKPQLEIWADDVKCSHGATTGQIDDEQMFYLRSRGLDKTTATALLLHAFAFDIVDRVQLKELRNYIAEKINFRLGYNFSE